ncbi:MAG: pyruvate, water dikinase regulatory protein [Veillonellaceae bacterium]|nr:pyruvate, water dikinase regulatory protein [Veillonellaceae bacterium]
MAGKIIFAISDSLGETAESVARATASQFDKEIIDIVRIPYINNKEQIDRVIQEAADGGHAICHTIVSPELRAYLHNQAAARKIPAVDIMGPVLAAVGSVASTQPRLTAGMVHKLDREYFKKVEAIEFAVKYDDGKNPKGFEKADIVIIGVSRTSKTPLSMFLAYKKIKAANLPLVPEVPLPEELFAIPPKKIVGLVIDPYKLNFIRSERLRSMGLDTDANYATISRIEEELQYAQTVMRRIHCPVLDVTNKSIEETASFVMQIIERNRAAEGGRQL